MTKTFFAEGKYNYAKTIAIPYSKAKKNRNKRPF